MVEFVEIELNSGKTELSKVLVKTVNALIVRTFDNRYLLISREFIINKDNFWKD